MRRILPMSSWRWICGTAASNTSTSKVPLSAIAASSVFMAAAGISLRDSSGASSDNECTLGDARHLGANLMFRRSECESLQTPSRPSSKVAFKRRRTENALKKLASRKSSQAQFRPIQPPLSDDEYGIVSLAVDRITGENVILKRIPKSRLDDAALLHELDALLQIRDGGGHPNICGMRKNFDTDEKYYEIIFDLVSGGTLIDHLQKKGPYSEANVADLIQPVASALAFLHGIGLVHADLKPETLMLSAPGSTVVKIVNCGGAKAIAENKDTKKILEKCAVAYLPPEAFERGAGTVIKPSMDMWAIGVILHILLTGVHPFDVNAEATDGTLMRRIRSESFAGSANTAHLSPSSIDLLEKLLAKNPNERITAKQMLDHPWVRGETSKTELILGSDVRLAYFHEFKLKGRISNYKDATASKDSNGATIDDPFCGISHVVLDNMKTLSFPSGGVIIKEGEPGSSMFYVKSGSIKIETKDGFVARLGEGDTFGEGSLLNPSKARNATCICTSPVEVIEITREFAKKFLMKADSDFGLKLKELDKSRGLGRAKSIINQQDNLSDVEIRRSQRLFSKGDRGDALYILDQGKIDIIGQGGVVFTLSAGDMFGEEALILEKPRNSSAICRSDFCKLKLMSSEKFHDLVDSSATAKEILHDLAIRRDFQRALALMMKKEHVSLSNIEDVFDKIDSHSGGLISREEARSMLRKLDSELTEKEIDDAVKNLDPTGSGTIELNEFKRSFVKSRVHNYPLQRRRKTRLAPGESL